MKKTPSKSGRKRVTITEVAREAGVSIAAVSRILNNSYEGFSARPETKERVYAAVRKLGYKPSRAAVRLATGRQGAIGLCYPEEGFAGDSNDGGSLAGMCSQLGRMLQVHGVSRAAAAARLDLVLMLRSSERTLDSILQDADESVDGIVYLNPENTARERKALEGSPVPVSVVGPCLEESPKLCQVCVDEFTAGRMAMGHLIVAGARRIVIGAPQGYADDAALAQRLEGATHAVKTYRDPKLAFGVAELTGDVDQVKAAFLNHVGRWGQPDGVLTLGGMTPFGILQALAAQKLRCPEDVKVVGFDENPMYQLHEPAVTGIRYPMEEICRKAAEMLLERIRSGKIPPAVRFTPRMIARRSSEAPLVPLY